MDTTKVKRCNYFYVRRNLHVRCRLAQGHDGAHVCCDPDEIIDEVMES